MTETSDMARPNPPAHTEASVPATVSDPAPERGRSMLKAAVQLLGFGIGIAMLIWCVRTVLSDDNRAQLEKLAQAKAWQILLLLGIAASSVVLNGVIFWAVLRPVRRLRVSDTVAVNGIGTFLGYLPFKISVIVRWLIHNRRDGVPSLMIGTWFLVVVGLMGVTVAPLGLALIKPSWAGAWWWVVVLLGVAASHFVAMHLARWVRGDAGLRRLHALRVPERWTQRAWFGRLHSGAEMAGDAHAVAISAAARVLDISGFALRFWIAATILGVPLTGEDAVLIGLAYFVIGVVSPFGTVGTREAGALAMAVGAGVAAANEHRDGLLTAILLVSATDAISSIVGAGFGMAWLRADRLLLGKLGSRRGAEGPGFATILTDADEPSGTTDDATDDTDEDRAGPDQPDGR